MLSVWRKKQFQKNRLATTVAEKKLSDDQRKRFSKTENARIPIVIGVLCAIMHVRKFAALSNSKGAGHQGEIVVFF